MMTIQQNVNLLPYNTFHVQAMARQFAAVRNPGELDEVLEVCPPQQQPVLVLGGGSNLLFVDDYDGLVIRNELMGITVVQEDDEYAYVQVGAGENWHRFVQYCVQNGLGGVENLSLIPGSTGASPIQNIGAYGVEVKDVFHALEAFHLGDRERTTFNLEDCEFGYRESVFKKKHKGAFIILHVTFRLSKKPRFNTSYGALEQELEKMGIQELSLQAVSEAVIRIRQRKLPDPARIGNAGSFFKNPEVDLSVYQQLKKDFQNMPGYTTGEEKIKLAAGWLIEQCGWKGYRQGDAGCYEKQALVLVNWGGATGRQIYQLSSEIAESVEKKFGVKLEREVNVIGSHLR
ncbi:MAG: UDP-N-acetylmuramate dehydrogenase [Williamsia sp.]|nr:UDP-N-acetylmuramate dehydrogenase [Williamsia sp.]